MLDAKLPVNSSPYHHSGRNLLVICTAAFLVPFMGSALNLALPQIAAAFSMKAVTLTWMSTIYLISTAVFQVPAARIADLVGRKKVFLTGVGIFTTCTFLCALAPSSFVLVLLRFLSGIGSAMMMGTNIAILMSLFPPQQRNRALGVNVAVVYAALAAGPLLGGVLTQYFGWKSLFFFSSTIGIGVLLLAARFIKGEWIEAQGERFDLWGSLLYGCALSGLLYGFFVLPSLLGWIILGAGILLFVGFARYELRINHPVFNIHLLTQNKLFALSSLAALINYAATAAVIFMLSLYLQYIRGFEATHAGMILISQATVQSIISLFSGRLTERFSASRVASVGMGIIVVGLVGLACLGTQTPIRVLILWLMLMGAGFGLFSSPNTSIIMSSVDPRHYSQASATAGTMRNTGQAFSMGVAGMSIALYVGNHELIPALYPAFMKSMQTTFIIFVGLCLLGLYASSVRESGGRTA